MRAYAKRLHHTDRQRELSRERTLQHIYILTCIQVYMYIASMPISHSSAVNASADSDSESRQPATSYVAPPSELLHISVNCVDFNYIFSCFVFVLVLVLKIINRAIFRQQKKRGEGEWEKESTSNTADIK